VLSLCSGLLTAFAWGKRYSLSHPDSCGTGPASFGHNDRFGGQYEDNSFGVRDFGVPGGLR